MTQRLKLAGCDTGPEELEAIGKVLGSGILTNGPQTLAFERAFAERHQVEHAVALANGTVALAGMMIAAGIGPGDEVIVPSMTFISTATSVEHVGATPVFADVRADTFNLDPSDVQRRLSKRTKAVMPVHYGGQPADLDELRLVCDEAGAFLFEDAAQAHGSEYRGRPVGGIGDAAMFSFTPTKNITTGEGGMITTNNGQWAERLRLLRNHGQNGVYNHVSLGFNWRMTEMQAAMGFVQMGKLDAILARKHRNASYLGERLTAARLQPPVALDDRTHGYMLYTLLAAANERNRILDGLLALDIEARVYFPPAHKQPIYRKSTAQLLVTEELAERMLSVPFHSLMSEDDLDRVADALIGLAPAHAAPLDRN